MERPAFPLQTTSNKLIHETLVINAFIYSFRLTLTVSVPSGNNPPVR
jgi:hypothetical protein